MKRILMVCTGNICRSPIAEAVFRRNLARSVEVESAGLAVTVGSNAHPHSIAVCRHAGIDISSHRSRAINALMMRQSDLVFAMETSQLKELTRLFPWSVGRVWRLGHHLDMDFEDLLGASMEQFERFFQLSGQAFASWERVIRS